MLTKPLEDVKAFATAIGFSCHEPTVIALATQLPTLDVIAADSNWDEPHRVVVSIADYGGTFVVTREIFCEVLSREVHRSVDSVLTRVGEILQEEHS